MTSSKKYQTALILAVVTIVYNLIEGGLSTYFGTADETLALLGFGVDSFVEVISGIGIAHMIFRIRSNPDSSIDSFEERALRITGVAFYILTIGLLAGAIISIISQATPSTTRVGIIISVVSILTMYILYRQKLRIGRELNSEPIISDANCTRTCFYLSFILLGSSLAYELLRIPFIDAIGSLGIAWYAFREGKEAFEKARNRTLACECD